MNFQIEINQLVKQYQNGVKALDNLSLTVSSGEIFALLGPNGAGKSSLIHILTTRYRSTSGNVTILGRNLALEPAWIRTRIACVAQNVSIDTHLSLMENMIFQSKLYRVNPRVAKERIHALIENFGLSGYLKFPVASYSGGVKRRLDIAMNMVSFPQILFLDEPTVGMDALSRKEMWRTLLKIRTEYGITIFLTTHYLEEADQLSDTICIMKDGKELVQGTPASLRSYIRQNLLRIGFPGTGEAQTQRDALVHTGIVNFASVRDRSVFASVDNGKKAFTVVNRWLLEHQADFNAIEIVEPSLEDVFLALTQ